MCAQYMFVLPCTLKLGKGKSGRRKKINARSSKEHEARRRGRGGGRVSVAKPEKEEAISREKGGRGEGPEEREMGGKRT